ncbi:MAG: response regulator [Nitrospirae bacterium]|nr:response regulator [Nitrospirota bacterium]
MAHKLLLADDSITIQKVVELVLAEEDFEIKSVSNGEDAMNVIPAFNPDIVLADIEMPKVNGYQLCENIKKNPKTSGIPVILLAGAFEPIDEELARKVGADDSVIKPFESQELISKINAALAMAPSEGIVEAAAFEGEEEVIAVIEEAEFEEKAEAVEVAAEEDLWAMEEISATPEEGFAAEAAVEEEAAGIEAAFEIEEEELPKKPEYVAAAPEPVAEARPEARKEITVQEVAMPTREEILAMIERSVNEKVSSMIAGVDIKEILISSLAPSLKDSIEKILWELTPDLVEKMLKEVLKGSISSLTSEVEKVIWETVPDLAGTLITKEIEKIKSEY